MINNVNSFGEFITKKREEKEITLREMAKKLDITPPYLSDIEKDRRNPPEKSKLDLIAQILNLSEEEKRYMYDLAGKKRNEVSPDLPDYIMERDYVRKALRKAMDVNAGEKEWLKFVEELEKRGSSCRKMYKPNLRTKENGIPILSKDQIDKIAECFIFDFCPDALKNPKAIDIDSFVMNYLKLKQDFQYLSHCGIYLGMIVFNDTNKVVVYNPDKNRAEYISAKEGTVIIDNTLLEPNQEGRYRFTMAHEGAHYILHKHIYQNDTNQISFFDNIAEPLVKCRSALIDGKIKPVQYWDDNDTMEWQANYMSSSILMPKSMVFALYHDSGLEKETDEMTGFDYFYLNEVLSEHVATVFNVSVQAAKIRLKNLGIIKTEDYSQNSFLKGRITNNYIKIANNF